MIIGRKAFVALITAGVLMLAPTAAGAAGGPPDPAGPGDISRPERPVADQYIVTLRDGSNGVSVEAQLLARAHGGNVLGIYQYALQGFTVSMTEAQAQALARASPGRRRRARRLRVRPRCPNAVAVLGPRPHRPARPAAVRDLHVHRNRRGREGVHHRHRHPRHPPEFGGRVQPASTPLTDAEHPGLQRPWHPRLGHGGRHHLRRGQGRHAHGRPRVRLRQQHHVGDHRRRRLGHRQPPGRQPAVANMSLGGGANTALDTRSATRRSRAQRAAGRQPADARELVQPVAGSVAEGITVGASDINDAKRRSRTTAVRRPARAGRASPRRGARATPPPTRSAGRRWPPRTWPGRPRFTSR